MRQSELFTKTERHAPRGEESVNAALLEQAGYVVKLMAGVYTYLPLGLRVLKRIEAIVRDEMNAIGGQEVYMPALQPKDLWDKTGRWEGLKDVMYQFTDQAKKPIGLAITHEEVVANMIKQYVSSYRDLPFSLYQIQTKFRHELRPKSGLTRGREFSMKDLYSCHATKEDLDTYYTKVIEAYKKVFKRCGLDAFVVEAPGGDFSDEYSHEFQVLTKAGEDHVFHCTSCGFAKNKEITNVKEDDECPSCKKGTIRCDRGIEVGNIFKLGSRYTDALGARFTDQDGKEKPILMASYGIGISRTMGTIVEVHHDDKGIRWPESVAPFGAHLLAIGESDEIRAAADGLARACAEKGIELLYDDRLISAGEKLHDADLIGIPHRLVVSAKTGSQVEYRHRSSKDADLISQDEVIERLSGT